MYMDPDDLLRIAEGLARGALGSGVGRPRQAELRRAVSAAYYSMFHAPVAASRLDIKSIALWNMDMRETNVTIALS